MSLRAKRNFREHIKRGLRADLVKWNATEPPNAAKGASNYRRGAILGAEGIARLSCAPSMGIELEVGR